MDSKELIVVEFGKTTQPAPYESETAKVSLTFAVDGDAQQSIRSRLDMVKTEVFTALGMAHPVTEFKDPAAEPAKRRGRPSNAEKAAQAQAETAKPVEPAKVEEQKPVDPEPSKDINQDLTDEFADPPAEAAKPIEDKVLQEECGKAAKIIGADKVKNLFQTKYGAARVSLVKQEERAKFLQDLVGLVEKAKSASV